VSLKEPTYQFIKMCLDGYITNKSDKESDSESKKNKCREFLATIEKYKEDDQKLLDISIEIGHEAHQKQLNGTYTSDYSNALFVVIHLIRSDVDKDILSSRIQREMYTDDEKNSESNNDGVQQLSLNTSRKRLIENELKIHAGEATDTNLHANIDTKTLSLAFLGCFNPLSERYELGGEMEKLYKPSGKLKILSAELFESTKKIFGMPVYTTGYEFPKSSVEITPSASYNFCQHIPSAWQTDFAVKYFQEKFSTSIKILSNSNRGIIDPTTNDMVEEMKNTPASSPLNRSAPLTINTSAEIKDIIAGEKDEKQCLPTLNMGEIRKTHYHIEHYLKLPNLIREEKNSLQWLEEKLLSNMPQAEKIFAIGNKANELQSNGAVNARCLEIFYLTLHAIRSEVNPASLKNIINKKKFELNNNRTLAAEQFSKSTQELEIYITYKLIHDNIRQLGYLGNLAPYAELKKDKKAKIYSSISKNEYLTLSPSNVLQDSFIENYRKKYAVDYLLDRITLFEELLSKKDDLLTRENLGSDANDIEVEINRHIDSDKLRVSPLKTRLDECRKKIEKLPQKKVTSPSSHALVSATLQQTPSTVVHLGSTHQNEEPPLIPEQKQEENNEEQNEEQDEKILGEFLDQQKWGSGIPESTRVKTFLEKSDHCERLSSMWETFTAQRPDKQDVDYFDPAIQRYTRSS